MVGVLLVAGKLPYDPENPFEANEHEKAFPGVVGVTNLFTYLRPADRAGWDRPPTAEALADLARGALLGAAACTAMLSVAATKGWVAAPAWGWQRNLAPGDVLASVEVRARCRFWRRRAGRGCGRTSRSDHALLAIVQSQSTQLKDLQTLVKDLQAKVGQTSRNSSKPPSSDPPSTPPKSPKVPRGRKAGGQVGHEGHQRPLVPPERVDEPVELLPEQCPDCHAVFPENLPTLGEPRRTQVWELPVIRPHITEYRLTSHCS